MSSRATDLAAKRKMRNMLYKTKTGEEQESWRTKRKRRKERNEEGLIEKKRLVDEARANGETGREKISKPIESQISANKASSENKGKPYSLSIAIPGSFLNNAQSSELRTYMAGQIARAATLFQVSEIIVYDETARMTDEQLNGYWGGHWYGDLHPSDSNNEANFHLARILEYLECPQYLRRALFLRQRPLQYAGLLNPLDSLHHLKADNLTVRYREGVILDKPVKKGRGPLVDIGLDKELQLEDETPLPSGTRITVEMGLPETDFCKRYRGRLTSAARVTKKTGLYWGYSVRLAKRIGEVVDRSKYDYIVGTSPKGKRAADMEVCTLTHAKILMVFGGMEGVDAAIEGDEAYGEKSAEEAFDLLLRPFVSNGSRSQRIEEDVLVGLSTVDSRLADIYDYHPE